MLDIPYDLRLPVAVRKAQLDQVDELFGGIKHASLSFEPQIPYSFQITL